MGIPIPFNNGGKIIPELYLKDMIFEIESNNFKEKALFLYTVAYDYLVNLMQI